jgi:hypothetical protein
VSRLRACKKPSLATQGELEPVSSSDLSQLLPTVLSFVCCLRVRTRAWLVPVRDDCKALFGVGCDAQFVAQWAHTRRLVPESAFPLCLRLLGRCDGP